MERAVSACTARSLAAALVLAAASSALSCSERSLLPAGQVLVYVDTDAPLARAPGEPEDLMAPPELFDELRVEIVAADGTLACDGCRRDFAVDRSMLAAHTISFGALLPEGRTDLTVRARLFRAVRLGGDGDPPKESTIDEIFTLPPIGADGVVEETARLSLARVGLGPSDTPQPLLDGAAYVDGLYPGVTPQGCGGDPLPGEVCIPGGAFWMANAETNIAVADADGPEHVVVLSPFFVDEGEVTVADLRASGLATAGDPRDLSENPTCTYSQSRGKNDDKPVTCLTSGLASRYCRARGKTLPSEAQFEYLASGLRANRFVWGTDTPECGDAVFGRNATDSLADTCVALGTGPQPRGSGARDLLSVGGGRVWDLAGNVHEFTRDAFQPIRSPCWLVPLLVDPVCKSASGRTSIRGGGIDSSAVLLRATIRAALVDNMPAAEVGFRCVRAASVP